MLNMFNRYVVTTHLTGYMEEVFSNGTSTLQSYGAYVTNCLPFGASPDSLNTCMVLGGQQLMRTIIAMNQTAREVFDESTLLNASSFMLGAASGVLLAYTLFRCVEDIVEADNAPTRPKNRLK